MLAGQVLRRHSAGVFLHGHRTREMQKKSQYSETLARSRAHGLRCRSLPPMQAREAAHLVAGFLASREVISCPTRYAAPVEQRQLQFARRGH